MSIRSDDDALFGLLIVVAIVLGFLALKFSNAIGVNWKIGLEIILKMFAIIAIWGAWKYFNSYSSVIVWPIALAGLCWAWFPALNVWAVEKSGVNGHWTFSESYSTLTIAWFGSGIPNS